MCRISRTASEEVILFLMVRGPDDNADRPAPACHPARAERGQRDIDGASGARCRVDRVLARHGDAQDGLAGRSQLLAAGLSPDVIDRRVASGHLQPIHPGVYAVGYSAISSRARMRAALMAAGPGSDLSFVSGAVLLSLLEDVGGPVHLTRPGSARRLHGVVVHRCVLSPEDRTHRRGLPVTTPIRTLLDLAPSRHFDRALNEALLRHLVDPAELLTRAVGRPGAAAIRRALEPGPTPTRSEAERRLVLLVCRAGLPAPRTNVRLLDYEVDAHWVAQRLVVEVDGYAAHHTRAAFERDRAKDATLLAAGQRVLRVTWRQLTQQPEAVAARLGAALTQYAF